MFVQVPLIGRVMRRLIWCRLDNERWIDLSLVTAASCHKSFFFFNFWVFFGRPSSARFLLRPVYVFRYLLFYFSFLFSHWKGDDRSPPMMYTSALLAGDLSWPPLDALAVYFGREKEQTHCGRDDPLRKMGEQLRRRTRGDSREIDTQQQPAASLHTLRVCP